LSNGDVAAIVEETVAVVVEAVVTDLFSTRRLVLIEIVTIPVFCSEPISIAI
jgi:hypothetical protein